MKIRFRLAIVLLLPSILLSLFGVLETLALIQEKDFGGNRKLIKEIRLNTRQVAIQITSRD